MTNLSDLFPAGAGKQVSFTASGNVTSSGKPVILNSDGTVAEVGETSVSQAKGSATSITSGDTNYLAMAYSTAADKFLAVFNDGSYAYYTIGTYSSGSPGSYTWTTPVKFRSANYSLINFGVAYSPDDDKFLITSQYVDDNNNGLGFVAEIDSGGTTVTMQAPVVFYSYSSYGVIDTAVVYDTNENKFLVAYIDGFSDGFVRAKVGSLSGTTLTYGSELEVDNSNQYYALVLDYSTTDQKSLVSFCMNTSNLYSRVLTVSGTSVTTGSVSSAWTTGTNYIAQCYDSSQNKFLLTYRESATKSRALTISGTTVSSGTETSIWSTDSVMVSATFDTTRNKNLVLTDDYSGNTMEIINVSIDSSGNLTAEAPFEVFSKGETSGAVVYDPDASVSAAVAKDDDLGSTYGRCVAYESGGSTTNLTASNFLGISAAAISSAASGNITIKGGIAATGLSSLTPASDYYVQTDGSISTTSTSPAVKIGKALSATAINLEYQS